MSDRQFTLAIVGCGLTGSSLFYQLVDKLQKKRAMGLRPARPLRIMIFEEDEQPGPGFPYNRKDHLPCHLLNMPAEDMSINCTDPADFVRWMNRHLDKLTEQYPELHTWFSIIKELGPDRAFPPRIIVGIYLRERFEDALRTAGGLGLELELHSNTEVIDIKDEGKYLVLEAQKRTSKAVDSYRADKVILATGHWFNWSEKTGVFSSPFPAANLLRHIPPGAKVAVIGTSLSAIDATLTLFADGGFLPQGKGYLRFQPPEKPRKVIMFSRNGYLPKVRGLPGRYQNRYFTMDGLEQLIEQRHAGLTWQDFIDLLEQELETAYQKPVSWDQVCRPTEDHLTLLKNELRQAREGDNPQGDILWQTVLFQALPVIRKAYIHFSPDQKQLFDDKYKSLFMAYASPIPRINANKIMVLLRSGLLEIKRLAQPLNLEENTPGGCYLFHYWNEEGVSCNDLFHYVVDARGQSIVYQDNRATLAGRILASGVVRLETRQDDKGEKVEKPIPEAKRVIKGRGILIDPDSNAVITGSSGESVRVSSKLYAVGAMTQGQVINVSMARECILSTNRIAHQLLDELLTGQ